MLSEDRLSVNPEAIALNMPANQHPCNMLNLLIQDLVTRVTSTLLLLADVKPFIRNIGIVSHRVLFVWFFSPEILLLQVWTY